MTQQEKFEELKAKLESLRDEAYENGMTFVASLLTIENENSYIRSSQSYSGKPGDLCLCRHLLDRMINRDIDNQIRDDNQTNQ